MSASISSRRSSPERICGSEHQAQMATSRRTPRACDGCRQRKVCIGLCSVNFIWVYPLTTVANCTQVKCDAVKPACDSCRYLRIPCRLYLFQAVSNWWKKKGYTEVRSRSLIYGLPLRQSSSFQRITRRVEELEQLAVQRNGTSQGPPHHGCECLSDFAQALQILISKGSQISAPPKMACTISKALIQPPRIINNLRKAIG
jgi:hypothetical protein